MPKIFNKKGAASYLQISTVTVDRYRKNGKLPFRKIGDRIVFTEGDLITFLDACAVPATSSLTSRERLEIIKDTGGIT